MVIFAVDDEANAREYLVSKILEVEPEAEVLDFDSAKAALRGLEEVQFDVCFLDIQMPQTNGIAFAKELKRRNPKSNIVFVTGYSEYMGDAFDLDASGYLLKPVMASQIRRSLDNLRYPLTAEEEGGGPDLVAQCFGDFEIFYKGDPIKFKYNKSKEVVAYLIDRKGAVCSNNQVIISLWDDDESHDSYYRSLLKDIHDTFSKLGCGDVFCRQRAGASMIKSEFRCDYYDFLDGKPSGISAYKGEYMNQYSWAEETSGALFMDKDEW